MEDAKDAAPTILVLIVEDEALLAMMLEASLTDAGYRVLGPVSSEKQAMQLAETTRPDLALVDIRLRDGGSGIAVARHLRERGIPSLFVSGQGEEARANRESAVGYLGKPYLPATVLASIEVIRSLAGGTRPPPPIPAGLELF